MKPSRISKHTSEVIKKIVESVFPQNYVAVLFEGEGLSQKLLEHKFDYIFFTGGLNTGKSVYEAAAKHLTTVTLELGGKSPVIVECSAKTDLAAKRIAFGKFLNAGQTCVAPDYVLVHESVADKFVSSLKKWIENLYTDSLNNANYGKIITDRHFERLKGLINGNFFYGSNYDESSLKIEPTLIFPATVDDAAMQEEIFGPVLPIIVYENDEQLFSVIDSHSTSLALYLFTTKKGA